MAHPRAEVGGAGSRTSSPGCSAEAVERINQFSLVGYIPGALGEFLTFLREELVAGCVARAHVTVLPPRPLVVDTGDAGEHLRRRLPEFRSFRIGLPRLARFDDTHVVYAEIEEGWEELHVLHAELNSGPLHFAEPYPFHPHVTLAQGLGAQELPAVFEAACLKWSESSLPRTSVIDTLTFVQNTAANRWLDLAEYCLPAPALTLLPG